MELSKEKVVPVIELKPVFDIKRREDFLTTFGRLLLKAMQAYSKSADKLSFVLMLNMADFVVDYDIYNKILLEVQEKSWIEKKVDNLLTKWGLSCKPEDLDINELMSIGTTHYFHKKWGSPKNFADDLSTFADALD